MRWNKDKCNDGYTTSHVTGADVDKLHSMVSGVGWHDCQAFLKNRIAAQLFPEKVNFDELFADIANGEYGEIEGSCNAYQSRHFDGNLISTGN